MERMILLIRDNLTYLIEIGLLLVITTGLLLWLRDRILRSERVLEQARLELDGANNRLAQAKNQAALWSRTDSVTGLHVRYVVIERFQFALALARRQETIFGIILVQLTNWDDMVRHLDGSTEDKLLTALSTRLLAVTREIDTVGRVRDFEFAILLPVLRNTKDIEIIVSKLRVALDSPIIMPGIEQEFLLTVHFGFASYPRDGVDWATLLKAADESLRLSRMQA